MMVIIEITDDLLWFKDKFIENDIKTMLAKPKSFSGIEALTQIIITITPGLVLAATKVISDMIKSKKQNSTIKISCNGTMIEGLTEENSMEILHKLLEKGVNDKLIN